ncbi:MAG: CDC27 family protein [Abditibacteriales bacterium]|nr:CDC27 family protein [Abditibacteriales bacterium]MDW8366342.1 tetratricopeptide repeat protein [Abditibacteriales bacterium]
MVSKRMWKTLRWMVVVSILLTKAAWADGAQQNKPQTPKEQAAELWEKAVELLDTGKLLEGVAVLERLVKLDPSDVRAWTMLGFNYAYNLSVDPDLKLNEAEQIKKGIDALKRGITAVPRSADLRFELGLLYYNRLGDTEAAIMVFEETLRLVDAGKAVLLDPEEKRPLRQWRRILMRTLAHAYERSIDFCCALRVYDRMIQEYADEDVARFMANYIRNIYNMAWEFYTTGRYREAIREIDAALANRVIAIGLYLKAECLIQLGEKEEAKKVLAAIINKNPAERVALNKYRELSGK